MKEIRPWIINVYADDRCTDTYAAYASGTACPEGSDGKKNDWCQVVHIKGAGTSCPYGTEYSVIDADRWKCNGHY